MQARLPSELGVKGERQHVALTDRDRVPVDLGEDLDVGTAIGDPRRPDEDGADRISFDPGNLEFGLEGPQLPSERVTLRRDVEDPEVAAVEHDQARARAEHGDPAGDRLAERVGQAIALDPEAHHGRFAAREHERVEALELVGGPHLAHGGAQSLEDLRVRLEPALDREDADDRSRVHQPRGESSCPAASFELSRLAIAEPRPAEAAATRAGSA